MLTMLYPGSVQRGPEVSSPLPLPGSGLGISFVFPESYPADPFEIHLLRGSERVPSGEIPGSLASLLEGLKDGRSTFLAVDGVSNFLRSNSGVLASLSRGAAGPQASQPALSPASPERGDSAGPAKLGGEPCGPVRGAPGPTAPGAGGESVEGVAEDAAEDAAEGAYSYSPGLGGSPAALYPMIDSHAHLIRSFGFTDAEIDHEVKEFVKLGGLAIVNLGDNAPNSQDALRTALRVNEWASKGGLPFRMFCAAGLHPYNAKQNWEEEVQLLQKFYKANTQYINSRVAGKKAGAAAAPERRPIVAVGECGLDLRTPERRENERFQIHAFHACCELAVKYDLPIVLHGHRPKEVERMIQEIEGRRAKYSTLRGIFHGFNGTPAQAEYLRSLCGGFFMSVNGFVTFQGTNVRRSVQKAGVDRVLLETDSPYMVPKELEEAGVARNSPVNVYKVCNALAPLVGVYPQILAEKSVEAAKEVYRLDM